MKILSMAWLLLGVTAHADSWMPQESALYPDDAGHYYVLVAPHSEGTGSHFVLAEAKGTSLPVKSERDSPDTNRTPAVVRAGDRIIAEGDLENSPLTVAVSSRGIGFAAVETYGSVGYVDSAVLVSSSGEVYGRTRLEDLFTRKEIEGFPASVSSIWWLSADWIDETEKSLVLVARNGQVRMIDFDKGGLRVGKGDVVVRAFLEGSDGTRDTAADLLASGEFPDARPILSEALARPEFPKRLAPRATVALAALGDESSRKVIDVVLDSDWNKPAARGFSFDDRAFAIRHLKDIFGDEALPRLRAQMNASKGVFAEEAVHGLLSIGTRSTAIFISLVEDSHETLTRHAAIKALVRLNAVEAVPALTRAARDKDDLIARVAIDALSQIRSTASVEGLTALLDEGGKHDGEIAQALFYCYSPRPVPALIKALRRWPTGSKERSRIVLTLSSITHEEFPPDPVPWEKWWSGHPTFDPTRLPKK